MKKFFVIILALALCLSFAACGGEDTSTNADENSKADGASSSIVSTDESSESSEENETPVLEGSVCSSETNDSAEDAPDTSGSSSDESFSHESSAVDNSQSNGNTNTAYEVLSDNAYTVYVENNGDGTYTLTGVIPDKVVSGKIVVSASKKLTLVKGSLGTTVSTNAINEKYDKNGVKGACVVFASTAVIPAGTVVFTATYKAEDGAAVSASDFTVPEWNLTSGTEYLATNKTAKVVIKYVD